VLGIAVGLDVVGTDVGMSVGFVVGVADGLDVGDIVASIAPPSSLKVNRSAPRVQLTPTPTIELAYVTTRSSVRMS